MKTDALLKYISTHKGSIKYIREVRTGCSLSSVIYIRYNGKAGYLKASDDPEEVSLILREGTVMKAIEKVVHVPAILDSGVCNSAVYMITAEAAGKSGADLCEKKRPEKLMEELCRAMGELHNIPIEGLPLLGLEQKLAWAEERVSGGLVDEDDFDDVRTGMKAGEILDWLVKNKPDIEDCVFTHGDFCLPNVFMDKCGNSSFIDLGRGGIACRYQDIALLLRSFQYNYRISSADEVIRMFEHSSGIDVDMKRVRYYQVLDELF